MPAGPPHGGYRPFELHGAATGRARMPSSLLPAESGDADDACSVSAPSPRSASER